MGWFASLLAWVQPHSSDSHATETKAQKTQSQTNENAWTYSCTRSPDSAGRRDSTEHLQRYLWDDKHLKPFHSTSSELTLVPSFSDMLQ